MDRMLLTSALRPASENTTTAPSRCPPSDEPQTEIHTTDSDLNIDTFINLYMAKMGASPFGPDDLPLKEKEGDASNPLLLSIVIPVYNESEVLTEFHRRLVAVLDTLGLPSEILYVNDGSTDLSLPMMLDLHANDARVSIVTLSRNFGKEITVTAGLDHVRGEIAVVIDADLQDPPEVIPRLVAKWHEGYDVVYARRRERRGDPWLKRTTAALFYSAIHQLGDVPIPKDTGDFRLLNRRCLKALASCRERRRFMKGLFSWIGFKQAAIVYDRAPRFAGRTKWNYWRLWNLAIEGITSFTIAPLKFATYSGLITALMAFLYGIFIVTRTMILGRELPGYASLMAVILFLSGAQLTAMGVIGEYVGRIFVESKARPLYLLDRYFAARGIRGEPIIAERNSRPETYHGHPEMHTSGIPDRAARNTESLQMPDTRRNQGASLR